MSVEANYFNNPFEDYTPELASTVIQNNTIKCNSKIVTGLNRKWEDTVAKFKYLDLNDYSVYTGTSGIALLKLKRDSTSRENLKEIKHLLQLHRLKGRRHTFLCGDTGPLAIGAVITHNLGEKEQYEALVEKIKLMAADVIDVNSDLPNEYLYGRAGYLYAVLFVNRNCTPAPFSESFIRQIIEAILISGQDLAKHQKFKCPLMYQWHESYYLGAAHGVSGILYLLLQAKEFLIEKELQDLVKPTIEYLTKLRFPSGNFPSSIGRDKDNKVQWCHGAPGFVFLYSQAYKIFGDSKYLQLALDCGDVVWQRGLLRKGFSICHGVSGNAYCFLELYKTTRDEKHLYRAIKFAEWCYDNGKAHEEHYPDRPLSLFEGVSGPMYLLLDIQKPLEAKFPGFTL